MTYPPAHLPVHTHTHTHTHTHLTLGHQLSIPTRLAHRLQSAGSLYFTSDTALIEVDFGSLVTIDNNLYLSACYYLSGSAITAGFGSLQTIGGQFFMSVVSW
jgi:hypothetical protein